MLQRGPPTRTPFEASVTITSQVDSIAIHPVKSISHMDTKSIRKTFASTLILIGALSCTTFVSGEEPVKVFVLAGQSNMQGHGMVALNPERNEGKGSLQWMVTDEEASKSFAHLVDDEGEWAERDDVKIWYFERSGNLQPGYGAREEMIGPELGFGVEVGNTFDEPVLLIKIAWGGKSLAADFRPPSSGGEVGEYYKLLVKHTRDVFNDAAELFPELEGRDLELVGIGWHQGWNDRVNQSFNDAYEENMANFIRDIRIEFKAPKLPFVIAETGMSGHEEKHPRAISLMEAQAAVAEHEEFVGNVAFVGTKSFYRPAEQSPSGQAYHWNNNAETYYLIGEAMGKAMIDLLPDADSSDE